MKQQLKNETENIEYEETIEKLLEKKKKDRLIKIILIIIIILLLLIFWLLGYRMGKIGYGVKEVVSNPDVPVDDGVTTIKVMQDDIKITKDTKLDIFNNSKFNGEKIIAPKSNGTYQFCVSNEVENDIIYNIKFFDKMKNYVNMKYRLKIDNIYIRGNEDKYVGIDELSVDNITVLKDSNNIFTLEWYWEDNDKEDTYVGSQEDTQYYTLELEINADILDKRK